MDIFATMNPVVPTGDMPGIAGATLLTVKDVNLAYGKKKILSNVNFQIRDVINQGREQGQVVSLIGRSGIGKSQLFRIMAGFTEFGISGNRSLTGELLIGRVHRGRAIPNQYIDVLGNVGVVSQNYKLLEHRTVKMNLLFTGATLEMVKDYCQQFDLIQHLDKFPMELSGGQRQRTAILQQVLTGNNFILLDEPFSGLDEIMLRKTIDLLLKISVLDEIKTLVIVSHDIENSMAISDTVFLMSKDSEDQGATIKEEHKWDLVKMGLAWNPGIKDVPAFRQLLKDVKSKL